ncbi:hypothetical protein GCM10022224_094950 [Nonomuraea antimicrobica]|uniref:Uncharacterized protein n=1 Tax=Nonomuraea antimicrobica TaxID=561173 RepID=A0ABP7E9Z1_9ACTN
MRARTLLLAGGATTLIAVAISLGGTGAVRSGGQQNAPSQASAVLRNVTDNGLPTTLKTVAVSAGETAASCAGWASRGAPVRS